MAENFVCKMANTKHSQSKFSLGYASFQSNTLLDLNILFARSAFDNLSWLFPKKLYSHRGVILYTRLEFLYDTIVYTIVYLIMCWTSYICHVLSVCCCCLNVICASRLRMLLSEKFTVIDIFIIIRQICLLRSAKSIYFMWYTNSLICVQHKK